MLLLPLVALSCATPPAQVCTQEFRFATVTAIDANSALVTDGTVSTVHVRTGRAVPITSIVDLVPGTYLVLDDGAVPLFRGEGEEGFRLTLTRPGQTPVAATYRFDAPGGCHIQKVSGPDTLVVP
jgi:hypothetical protein